MTTNRTFAATLNRSLVKGGVWFLVLGVAFLALAHFTSGIETHDPHDLPGYPERVAAAHDCWTGEAPEGVEVPCHVVVRFDGEVAVSYRGAKAVEKALAHIFDGADNGVADVTAFCR